MNRIKFVFFGSSEFSNIVLNTLKENGFEPVLSVTNAKKPLNRAELESLGADVFIVASFGKILPDWLIYMPKFKTLNVHPSLLPKLRGPSPIQGAILSGERMGVTIQQINERVDAGPILTQKEVVLEQNLGYREIEKILAHEGALLLKEILTKLVNGDVQGVEQDHSEATYTKMITKNDADVSNDTDDVALRKVRAYEVWPRARKGDLIITKAHIEDGKFVIDRIIPPGKKEMDFKDYLRGNKID
ncbi:MAG: methionyl-tRNA formyltransferase [Parcubacteria bacterium C7867-005]|nr:MAG: methionyl-tRNA formyltransferase [Parcubacteria bacterium C7867-005]